MGSQTFGCFGNMMPPKELDQHPYLLNVEPFRIKGNLYFVGTATFSTHLIDTGDGLIILDVPPFQSFPYVLNNIWRLGFDPRDIKLIIISHGHVDHYGSANAMKHLTGATTALGKVDADDMAKQPEVYIEDLKMFGGLDEHFVPDITLEDGQVIEMGNTKIRCVWIPGHSLGAMAHFWECQDGDNTYKVGIYGGAGFVTLQDAMIKRFHYPENLADMFLESIDKVWDEHVDIMLGNHPFHSRTLKKRVEQLEGNADAFIDPGEWHRYLTELRDDCLYFLSLDDEGRMEEMKKNHFEEYSGQYLRRLQQLD